MCGVGNLGSALGNKLIQQDKPIRSSPGSGSVWLSHRIGMTALGCLTPTEGKQDMKIRSILLGSAALALLTLSNSASAQDYTNAPRLFANQYTQGYANQATAEMYVAPVPVPEWVGHTYYTYQPLYPHEMMYSHTRRYHSYYDGGRGLNSTKVRYSPSITGMLHSHMGSWLPRP